MERKWVVAAFLDLTGFRSWTCRASTAPEIKEKFIEEFYTVLQEYVSSHHGSWSKYEGDGILTIREFLPAPNVDRRSLVKFILELKKMVRNVKKVLKRSETAPGGVRIRLISGYVYKIMVLDPNDPKKMNLIPEYLEYCTNTVRGLLEVNPEIACLATENLVKTLGKYGSTFGVRPLGKPSTYPKGVNMEDVETLQVLRF